MKTPSAKMDVPRPIHTWLTALRAQLEAEKGRSVTFPEVWEHIRDEYERAKAEAARLELTITSGGGTNPDMGRIMQVQADAERKYG